MKDRILVVDDEIGALTLLRLMLIRNGFEAIGAKDARNALALLDEFTPNLMIVDVMMPDMDGIELCQVIRTREDTRTTPIIILTARSTPDSIARGLKAGANEYLTKPIQHRDLVAKIRHILGEKAAAKDDDTKAAPEFFNAAVGQFFERPAPVVLPQLAAAAKAQWADTFRQILRGDNQKDKGRAVIALAQWQKDEDAPFNTTPGQGFLWAHIRHSLAGLMTLEAEQQWAQLAPVALALTQEDRSQIAPALQPALDQPSWLCRQLALLVLLKDHAPSAIEAATRALKDKQAEVRSAALDVFREMGESQHVPLLAQALKDAEASVRDQVALALASIHGEMGLMALETAVLEGDAPVAKAVANALSIVPEEAACTILVRAARDRTEPPVLCQVAYALAKYQNQQSHDALLQLAKHPDSSVSTAATQYIS